MKRYFAAMMATCAAVAWDAGASLARANDSSAELAVGGLVFTKNADVSIESEDLTITPDTVTVRYVFLNQSASPVTLTVAFPLPDIDLADGANVAFLHKVRLEQLDVSLIASALECRQADADPDPLFPARTSLPSQVDACAALLAGAGQ